MLLRTTGALADTAPVAALMLFCVIWVSRFEVAVVALTNVLAGRVVVTKLLRSDWEMAPLEEAKVTAVTPLALNAVVVSVGITIFPDVLPSLSVCKNCAIATAEGAEVAVRETPATS